MQVLLYFCVMKQHCYHTLYHILCYLLLITFICSLSACHEEKKAIETPWGTTLGSDTTDCGEKFGLDDIIHNGELIMLTMTGPETYYDYHGHGMGLQYLLCERFAEKIGVSLRVEVCKDTLEMIDKVKQGDGDIIAFQLPVQKNGLLYTHVSIDSLKTKWAVRKDNEELADSLNNWFKPAMIAQMRAQESFLLSTRSVIRRVYSPFLSRSQGVISRYDTYFKQYASLVRWDWRLMAAQCYQESTFDPNAKSWAGACGLMQIMPSTAAHLGLPMSDIHQPEQNIAAAAQYLRELSQHFSDIYNVKERQYFVLASYNGGFHHVRDAMALTKKYGGNPYSWCDVSEYILKLSSAAYYLDPVVKYGYMRGAETIDYVERIRVRYAQYRGVASGSCRGYGSQVPRRAKHAYRFHV